MNYQTKLMQQILTNEKAQEIIDYVSQLYGESYVGLWLFQTIGSVLGPVYDLSAQLRYETSAATTTLLLSYYEEEYGIQADPTMTIEQRRNIVVAAMRSKGACNPARLGDAVSSALGGVPVEIIEYKGTSMAFTEIEDIVVSGTRTGQKPDGIKSITNEEIDDLVLSGTMSGQDPDGETSVTSPELDQVVIYGTELNQDGNLSKNEFIVSIRAAVKSTAPATAVIERMKPAHLIYTMRGVTEQSATTDITIGAALTTAEHYIVRVVQTLPKQGAIITDSGENLVTSDGDVLVAKYYET